MFELKFVEHEEVAKDAVKFERDTYMIGNYKLRREMATYGEGQTWLDFSLAPDMRVDYIPDIYYYEGTNGKVGEFKIQTSSYGSKSVEDIQKLVEKYQEAIEVVNILTTTFLK